jgi:hypothetical protein
MNVSIAMRNQCKFYLEDRLPDTIHQYGVHKFQDTIHPYLCDLALELALDCRHDKERFERIRRKAKDKIFDVTANVEPNYSNLLSCFFKLASHVADCRDRR